MVSVLDGRSMTALAEKRLLTVALVGNPNTGKSTLFNALCGLRQRVGNYPGVTVEKKQGYAKIGGGRFAVLDLPGSYSLSPRSPDEMVVVDVLLGRRSDTNRPDAVVCILDACNLERNLYLASQVLELALPTVLVLNMTDVAQDRGIRIAAAELESLLQIPVVEMQANRKLGLDRLKSAVLRVLDSEPRVPDSPFPELFRQQVAGLEVLQDGSTGQRLPRYLLERLLLDTSGYLANAGLPGVDGRLLSGVESARGRLAQAGLPVPAVEAIARYRWAGDLVRKVVQRKPPALRPWTARVDRILTHRWWGSLVFVLAMLFMFQSVFYVAKPASAAIEGLNQWASAWIAAHVPPGALQSLLVDGLVEGVGGVLVFLPQILVLFLFVGVLEDCGYMARAAYLMDKVMSRFGLSGKSFIPLLSSFACAVPGIMSARVIEDRRDRLITMLIAPLMSCSARLPVYTLFIAAFLPDLRWFGGVIGLQGAAMFAMYSLGLLTAAGVAGILRKTILRGDTPPFILELPAYKLPGVAPVAHRMWDRGWDFVQRAGTLILAVTILVWAAAYYPRHTSPAFDRLVAERDALRLSIPGPLRTDAATAEHRQRRLAELETQLAAEQLERSYLGRIGRVIEPAVKPLGWDWRIGCAVIASLPAREVVIATLGVIYHVGADGDSQPDSLAGAMRAARRDNTGAAVFTVPVACSLLVFFALCAQCASTLVVLRRESGSWKWPALAFTYMTTLAYLGAFLTFQVGTRLMEWK